MTGSTVSGMSFVLKVDELAADEAVKVPAESVSAGVVVVERDVDVLDIVATTSPPDEVVFAPLSIVIVTVWRPGEAVVVIVVSDSLVVEEVTDEVLSAVVAVAWPPPEAVNDVPSTLSAKVVSQQSISTPLVVFIGRATQVELASHCPTTKAPSEPHSPMLPPTQATWPGEQAVCSVRPAKMALYCFACARLLA
jgi:hypothetical protein